jgi:hypothetical protein
LPRKKIALSVIAAAVVAVAGFAITPTFAATPAATPVAGAPTIGMLPDNAKPKVTADFDRSPVELGIRFSPTTSGQVTALQYYQTGRGSHVEQATLWAQNGKVLARKKFKPSKKVGWRTIALDKPVSLAQGKTYVASYHAKRGGYGATYSAFTKAKTSNSLSIKSGAGIFKYSKTSKMPSTSYRNSNYYVDVVFKPSKPSAVKPTPPTTQPAPPVTTPPTTKPTTPPVTTKPTPPTTQPAPPVTTPTAPAAGDFPTASTTGIPSGWTPKTKVTGDYWVRTDGAVVQDLQITNGAIHLE